MLRLEAADDDAADDPGTLWLSDVCAEALVADVAEVTSVLEVADVALVVTSVLVFG